MKYKNVAVFNTVLGLVSVASPVREIYAIQSKKGSQRPPPPRSYDQAGHWRIFSNSAVSVGEKSPTCPSFGSGWHAPFIRVKGQCHEIFGIFLFHESKPFEPLINRLKWFCLKVRYCDDIREKFDSTQCYPARGRKLANTARCQTNFFIFENLHFQGIPELYDDISKNF